jgi:hypothetical protein
MEKENIFREIFMKVGPSVGILLEQLKIKLEK